MKRVLHAVLILTTSAVAASASERHFAYTYESAVLRPGAREIEPWSTFRLGRSDFYSRLDTRLEAELGLSESPRIPSSALGRQGWNSRAS